jgi:hypothetical protein
MNGGFTRLGFAGNTGCLEVTAAATSTFAPPESPGSGLERGRAGPPPITTAQAAYRAARAKGFRGGNVQNRVTTVGLLG